MLALLPLPTFLCSEANFMPENFLSNVGSDVGIRFLLYPHCRLILQSAGDDAEEEMPDTRKNKRCICIRFAAPSVVALRCPVVVGSCNILAPTSATVCSSLYGTVVSASKVSRWMYAPFLIYLRYDHFTIPFFLLIQPLIFCYHSLDSTELHCLT
jgi:hypothetical protein